MEVGRAALAQVKIAMNIFDFLTQDELEAAPDDGPLAFTNLVAIAQKRLAAEIRGCDGAEDDHLLDLNYDFVNVVIGLAKSYGIAPFAKMEVPLHDRFSYSDQQKFKADLDHYMTQLVVSNAIRARRDSAVMAVPVKERIRSHLHHIRETIDRASLSDAKRANLMAKLAEFEAALEKDRVNLARLSVILLHVLSGAVGVAALSDSASFHKLISNVMQSMAEAKAADDENRQLTPSAPPLPLLPPRRDDRGRGNSDGGGYLPATTRETFSADLDDEIPF